MVFSSSNCSTAHRCCIPGLISSLASPVATKIRLPPTPIGTLQGNPSSSPSAVWQQSSMWALLPWPWALLSLVGSCQGGNCCHAPICLWGGRQLRPHLLSVACPLCPQEVSTPNMHVNHAPTYHHCNRPQTLHMLAVATKRGSKHSSCIFVIAQLTPEMLHAV